MKKLIAVIALYVCCVTAEAAPESGVPAYKVVAPNGQTSYLLGSMHIPYAGLRQPTTAILQNAKHLVVEHTDVVDLSLPPPDPADPLNREAFKNIKSPENMSRASWAKALTPTQISHLQNNAKCKFAAAPDGAAMFAFNVFIGSKSPRDMSDLAMYPCDKFQQKSRDAIFAEAAPAQGVPIVGLETLAAVGKQRNAVPDHIYEKQLYETLTGKTNQHLAEAVDAFNQGDFLRIKKIALGDYEHSPDDAIFEKIMIAERNLAWMPELRRYLDIGQAVVVVGAAHLADPDGIISLLKNAGYVVEPSLLPTDHIQQ